METLSNFASIYCFISFVIGAVLMLVSLAIAAMGKDNEPRNIRARQSRTSLRSWRQEERR